MVVKSNLQRCSEINRCVWRDRLTKLSEREGKVVKTETTHALKKYNQHP